MHAMLLSLFITGGPIATLCAGGGGRWGTYAMGYDAAWPRQLPLAKVVDAQSGGLSINNQGLGRETRSFMASGGSLWVAAARQRDEPCDRPPRPR